MKKFFKLLVNIIAWILLFAAFASMGFSSDDPAIGIPVFGIFFILVFFFVYLYIRKHQRRSEPNYKTVTLIHRILGIALIIIGLLSPLAILNKADFPASTQLLLIGIAAVLMALGVLAVVIINNSIGKKGFVKFLGYLILIVISAIPALLISTNSKVIEVFSNLYSALGMAYWAAIALAIFGWWGFSLLGKKQQQ
ncbi:MAG: hypothetical protein SVM86_03215 [Candidatus Cloacimonadota bacterium]|nr:hypothetical protein [Candidatus Cloacimonadota bacterium]